MESSLTDSEWKEIDRRGMREEKARKTKQKRKQKVEETMLKARSMLGIGPVLPVKKVEIEGSKDKEKARRKVIKEMLEYHLNFIEEEFKGLDVRETYDRKENYLYFAAGNLRMLREIHLRKAESRNDELLIRNFVPPKCTAGTWR